MSPHFDAAEPARTFPFDRKSQRTFIVPIYPEYRTELLPDSILRTEAPGDFVEQQSHPVPGIGSTDSRLSESRN